MNQHTPERRLSGVVPPPHISAAVKALALEIGEKQTCAKTKVSRPSIARIAAGLPVHRSTLELVRIRLGLPETEGPAQ